MNNETNKTASKVTMSVHEAALRARIRALLTLPMNKRTNFLRKRLSNGGSCI